MLLSQHALYTNHEKEGLLWQWPSLFLLLLWFLSLPTLFLNGPFTDFSCMGNGEHRIFVKPIKNTMMITPKHDYKNFEHGTHVHLPWWAGMITIGIMTVLGSLFSYMSSNWIIVWCVAGTSLFYFWAYNYVHTCFHVPNDRWFEKTGLYQFLDLYHQIHHAWGQEWGGRANICLVCPLADWIMGTMFLPKKATDSTSQP